MATGRSVDASRYQTIPTMNVKFERFITTVFQSRMTTEDVKDQIVKYVQALETSYTEAIKDLKSVADRNALNMKKSQSVKINEVTSRNELETLFVDCIEEVRKEIMKRRLQTEIKNRKQF